MHLFLLLSHQLHLRSSGLRSQRLVKVKVTQYCPTLCDPRDYTVHGILQARILEMGSHSLLQRIFPIQGLNPDLPHCRRILYQLNHQGSPRILEWVAIPSPVDLPDPGIKPRPPALQADSFQLSYRSPALGQPLGGWQSPPSLSRSSTNVTNHTFSQDVDRGCAIPSAG